MGHGQAVVLVHGALGDMRLWERHLPYLAAAGYRAIAMTLPHHGQHPKGFEAVPFGMRAHVDALADFLRALDAGPVHLVGWSYGAHAALTLAVEQPELLRSLLVYEPGFPTFVAPGERMDAFVEDVQRLFAPVSQAAANGDIPLALAHLIDGSANRPGFFQSQNVLSRQIQTENAHTILSLLNQIPPTVLSAQDIASIRVPTCVAMGAQTRPAYSVVARCAQILLPDHALIVPDAGHMWPDEDPAGFCKVITQFLEDV